MKYEKPVDYLKAITHGHLGLARMILSKEYWKPGARFLIDTNTGPGKDGTFYMKITVKKWFETGEFLTEEQEPFFGYNRFHMNQIVS